MQLLNPIRKAIISRADKIKRRGSRSSNTTMNLIKAYSIIYIVSFHIYEPALDWPLSNWVIHSHIMALFAFVSGYFYKPGSDDTPWPAFLMQKVRGLLLPYFIWNFIYLSLTTLLNAFTPLRYGENLSLYTLLIQPWVRPIQSGFMLPAWYLLAFFLSLMILFTLRRGMKKLNILNEYVLWGITVLLAALSIVSSEKGYNISPMHTLIKAGYFLPYLQAGILFHRHENLLFRRKALSIGVILGLIYILSILPVRQGNVDMLSGAFSGAPSALIAWTLLSMLLAIVICEMLAPAFRESRIVKAIGENTAPIMFHHPAVLTAINLGIFLISRFMDIDFNIEKWSHDIWYFYRWRNPSIALLYTAICVAVPVLIKIGSDKLILRLAARISIKE